MGLLDYADSARKKLAGLLGDMPLVQMAQGRAEMPTMAGLLGALKSMPVFSPDAGQSAYEAALNIGPMGLGKIVYHGSPHKFDKFDASKIGTGEGAQAYGHGVYLADAEKVAEGYARDLGTTVNLGRQPMLQNNKVNFGLTNSADLTDAILANHGDTAKARKMLLESAKEVRGSAGQPWYDKRNLREYQKALAELRKIRGDVSVESSGNIYKADLPDEWIPKMLDWDKPLSQQSPEVQKAIKKAGMWPDKAYDPYRNPDNVTGADLVRGSDPAFMEDRSMNLRELGIPGIRYLDGGSRGKGRGSYNYVVFPGLEDQVKILERNGIPLSGLLGGN